MPRGFQNTPQAQIILPMLENAKPETSKLSMAKAIHKSHPQLWPTVDRARKAVNYYSGTAGKFQRENIAKSIEHPGGAERRANPYGNFPKPLKSLREAATYRLDGERTVGVLSDAQMPYYDKPAVIAALEYCERVGITDLLLNGDWVDFPQISRFSKDPEEEWLQDSCFGAREMFAAIHERHPTWRKHYKIGNHEARVEAFYFRVAPELHGMPGTTLAEWLEFERYGIEEIGSHTVIEVGDLYIIHGHELPGRMGLSGVYPAKNLWTKVRASAMAGHVHKTDDFVKPEPLSSDRRQVRAYTTGCLCNLRPKFMPVNDWNHGFAIVRTRSDGSFEVENKRIEKGRVI